MSYGAVIFDLFGTLVSGSAPGRYVRLFGSVARILEMSPAVFAKVWWETYDLRVTGQLKDINSSLKYACQRASHVATEDRIEAAAEKYRALYMAVVSAATPGSLSTLQWLKSMEHNIGMISNCSCEVPELWERTPFATLIDAPVFSCCSGLLKPDPRIYFATCATLGVRPSECLYVGDGSDNELEGAKRVGMTAVQFVMLGQQVGRGDIGSVKQVFSFDEVKSLMQL